MVGHIPLEDVILVRIQVPQFLNIVKKCEKKANFFAFDPDSNAGAIILRAYGE